MFLLKNYVVSLDILKPFNQFLSPFKNEIDVYQNIGQHHVPRVDKRS